MKMLLTVTSKEVSDTIDKVSIDPCSAIRCFSVNCASCPLNDAAQALKDAQVDFLDILTSMAVVDE